ncbi:uncharacterized protein BDR25DRAFT_354597 [Lindgomyces ingoldianus]|uniref:Uncharacterized protein n=1 Tax=Lindgomyces ingoldianus TaxID=673940 RepID=A0ACB6QX18_9PLEO|nr:uncharacterized protein BDR25DRAFT_354597 [Lindgomyces ingoldianus]KAF2471347.1 hypothetical protein BDR25DRAFT_354597 [Lindgomyces ingoldianus]
MERKVFRSLIVSDHFANSSGRAATPMQQSLYDPHLLTLLQLRQCISHPKRYYSEHTVALISCNKSAIGVRLSLRQITPYGRIKQNLLWAPPRRQHPLFSCCPRPLTADSMIRSSRGKLAHNPLLNSTELSRPRRTISNMHNLPSPGLSQPADERQRLARVDIAAELGGLVQLRDRKAHVNMDRSGRVPLLLLSFDLDWDYCELNRWQTSPQCRELNAHVTFPATFNGSGGDMLKGTSLATICSWHDETLTCHYPPRRGATHRDHIGRPSTSKPLVYFSTGQQSQRDDRQSPRGPTATPLHRRQASSALDESNRHNPPGVRTPPRLSSATIVAGAASARPTDSSGSLRDSRSQSAEAPPAFRPGSLQLPLIESLLQHPPPRTLQPPPDPFMNLPSLGPYRFLSTAPPQPLAYDLPSENLSARPIRDPDIPANILARIGSRPGPDYELGWVRASSNPAGSSPPAARLSALSTGRRSGRRKSGQAESSTKARKKKTSRTPLTILMRPILTAVSISFPFLQPVLTPSIVRLIKAYGRIELSLCQRAQQSLVRHKGADDEIWKAVPAAVKPFATGDQNDPFYIIQDFQARADSSTVQSVNFPLRRQDYQYLIMVAGAQGAVEVPRGKECKRCQGVIKPKSGVTEDSCRTFPYGEMGRYADRSCINCADTCTNCCLNPELKGKTPPRYDPKRDAEARKKFSSARGYNDDNDIGGSGKDNQDFVRFLACFLAFWYGSGFLFKT